MAISQEQVDAWFAANPNATAADIAAAVQSIGGLSANEGLSGMIANRYAIAEPEVTNYYNAYTAPKAETPAEAIARIAREQAEAKRIAEANLAALQPTFTDTITAGKPTTETELLTALGSIPTGTTATNAYFQANPDVAAAYKANSYGLSADEFANAHWNSSGRTEGRASPNGTPATTNVAATTTGTTGAADLITSGTPTTQAELLTALADTTPATTTAATTAAATTPAATTSATTTATGTAWPSIIYGTTGTDGDVLTRTTTTDGTPFYLHDTDSGGYYQNPNTVESYAPVTGADGKTYYAIYAPVFSSGKAWNETPITGYMTEAQFRAFQGGSTFGDAVMNIVNSPVGQFALGVLGPYGQAFNAANQASQGNYLGAAVSGLGAAQGFGVTDLGGFAIKDIQNVARGLNAIDKNDLVGALTAGSNLAGGIPGDYTTVANLASATLALRNSDTAGFLAAMGELTGSADAKTAAAAARLLAAVNADNPNIANIQAAATALNSAISGTGSTTGSTTGAGTSAAITTLSAEDLAELQPGELAAYESGGVNGLAEFRRSMRALTSLTGTGYTGVDNIGTTSTTLTGGTGNDTLTGATGNDVTSFTRSLGTLDQLDLSRTADEFADFLATLGITNATQLTDSGLSNQDILDLINAGVDTVTVTGGTGNDTITDTTTGTTTNVKTGLTCAQGFVPNAAGTECVAVVTVEACRDGKVRDPITGECVLPTVELEDCTDGKVRDPVSGLCVLPTTTGLTCADGFAPNAAGTECIPTVTVTACGPGKVRNEAGECVAINCGAGRHFDALLNTCVDDDVIKKTLNCAEGYKPNEAGTECIPVVTVEACGEGKVRDPVTGECVFPKTTLTCPTGFQPNAAGTECIPITTEIVCADGYELDETGTKCIAKVVVTACKDGKVRDPITGECVLPTLNCPEGYAPNAAGTECIPVVNVEACKDGKVRDPITGQCVLPTTKCAEGFHDDGTGLCVPDDDEECKPGFELVGGKCEPVCKEGYLRNLETGQCEKVEDKTCPIGQVKDASGKCVPIKNNNCQPGFEKVNDVCVPVCQPGYVRVNGVCKKITTDTATPATSALGESGEKTDPIYAGGMDDFNLLATLQELLASEAPKKDDKKSKDKTKMASGGHLDDLLAEQMTVDDLLKLLR